MQSYEKVPRYKKFNGKKYTLHYIAFTKKYANQFFNDVKKECGSARTMKYRHKSGAIEYAIYGKI